MTDVREGEEETILRKMMHATGGAQQASGLGSAPCPRGVVSADRETFYRMLRECRVLLVDFSAEWCGPCKMVEPIVKGLAEKYTPMIGVAKVDVDKNSELAFEYGVMSVPTVIVFNAGKEHRRFVGYHPGLAKDLSKTLESLVK